MLIYEFKKSFSFNVNFLKTINLIVILVYSYSYSFLYGINYLIIFKYSLNFY